MRFISLSIKDAQTYAAQAYLALTVLHMYFFQHAFSTIKGVLPARILVTWHKKSNLYLSMDREVI